MSARSTALVPGSTAAVVVASPTPLEVPRFDHWIGRIEEHIGDLEGHIRERSLAGEETALESFNLQKLELLLEIAREAKARV